MKLIVTSSQDIAGSNMYELFIKEFGFQEDGQFDGFKSYKKDDFKLIKIKKDIGDIEHLPESFEPSLYICASRHRAEKEVKSLTVHTPGNWGEVGYYGQEKKISESDALAMRKALQTLNKNKKEDYEVTLEVTHHGPSVMNAPVTFVEVGSTEKEWEDLDMCREVCKSILSLEKTENVEIYAGFGGPHYAPNFTKAVLEKNVAVGHIIPKHYLDKVDETQILDAIRKTKGCSKALIDWKGMNSEQRQKIVSILEKNNIEYKKIKEL